MRPDVMQGSESRNGCGASWVMQLMARGGAGGLHGKRYWEPGTTKVESPVLSRQNGEAAERIHHLCLTRLPSLLNTRVIIFGPSRRGLHGDSWWKTVAQSTVLQIKWSIHILFILTLIKEHQLQITSAQTRRWQRPFRLILFTSPTPTFNWNEDENVGASLLEVTTKLNLFS